MVNWSFFDLLLPNVTVESDWIWPCFVTIFAQGRNVVWILFVVVFYDIASLFVIYLYRHNGRSNVSSKPKRETGDVKKQNSSKDRKDRTSQTLQCYLQRSSHGGIMLLELLFEVCLNKRTWKKLSEANNDMKSYADRGGYYPPEWKTLLRQITQKTVFPPMAG